ncbi:cysteine-rich receptor-like protein kinase 2 [Cinnamomum micranthum f. kanehirae]|uniref:Cysteine-rich receptor-like protein kinase 2 n=1 Tax=Cinnamomum micranthum f. kanehirae TaxID=337451 RepID=A0A443PQ29_9MAGN|nr:cysteine-rich receptor-like protein kinase 2 [Cinnamomum micranthum f. kanehirae]
MEANCTHSIFSLFTLSSLIIILFFTNPTTCDPQTNLITKRCSPSHSTSSSYFFSNLHTALSSLQTQLFSSHFATAQHGQGQDEVFTMAQCRKYLSISDCLSCVSSAASLIRNCSPATNGRVYYDGCFLRYQEYNFFDEATDSGNTGFCGNRTAVGAGGFKEFVGQLLRDLCSVTPRIDGYFAAVKREEVGGGGVVYGVAQCSLTVSEEACGQCLQLAYQNIEACPPVGDGRAIDEGCFLRYSDTPFFSNNQTTDVSFLLKKGGSNNTKANIGGTVGGAVLVLLLVLLYLFYRRSTEARKNQQEIIGATELRGPVIFQYDDLKSATRNFSDNNKLGGGGFGDVYKGIMRDGKIVAVKRLMVSQSDRVKEDFHFEVKLINNVHHRNLVRLLGCCSKGPELLLVYEFMANNSLDKYLFGERRGTLNWKQRLDIIIGIARGLTYLHEEFHICIIHRDIKPNNILLDDEFQPKIADFGLARLLPGDRSHLSTKFGGTLGYMAPEYAIKGTLSEKADVYSYGVVVLEIISGRKSSEIRHEPVTEYLIEWAWRLYEGGTLMELVDESLDPNDFEPNEVNKVIEIGLMCTQSVRSRPTMSDVVVLLLSNGELGLTLTRPNFINSTHPVQTRVANGGSLVATELPASNATVSISELYAR